MWNRNCLPFLTLEFTLGFYCGSCCPIYTVFKYGTPVWFFKQHFTNTCYNHDPVHHSWIITVLVTRVHGGCHAWSRSCLSFKSTWVHPHEWSLYFTTYTIRWKLSKPIKMNLKNFGSMKINILDFWFRSRIII